MPQETEEKTSGFRSWIKRHKMLTAIGAGAAITAGVVTGGLAVPFILAAGITAGVAVKFGKPLIKSPKKFLLGAALATGAIAATVMTGGAAMPLILGAGAAYYLFKKRSSPGIVHGTSGPVSTPPGTTGKPPPAQQHTQQRNIDTQTNLNAAKQNSKIEQFRENTATVSEDKVNISNTPSNTKNTIAGRVR
jgi:hypothetical protein